MTENTLLESRRQAKRYKKHLANLTAAVESFLRQHDELMKQPPTAGRGRKIAQLSNNLDMENDLALHFGLDLSFKKIAMLKKKELQK